MAGGPSPKPIIMTRTQVGLISLALFLAGIALRLPGLNAYLTPDEHLWAGRTAQFMLALADQDWSATSTSGHPGVTTTWAGSIGVTLRWLFDRPADAASLRAMAETLATDTTNLAYLRWLRLPVLLLCAAGGVLFFLLSRRLLGDAIAVLAALFVLLDPFWLAHSKIIHLDALLTLTVTLAWLLLLLATQTHRRAFYLAAGIAIGLGVLTKSPALALGPLIVGWLLFDRLSATARAQGERRRLAGFGRFIVDCLWVGVPAALVIFTLWPAMWVAPLDNIRRVLGLMETYGQTGHELGNFWMGQAVASPGGLFYGAVILWRTMPITLIGGALALVFTLAGPINWSRGFSRLWRQGEPGDEPAKASTPTAIADLWRTLWGLWLFVGWYVVILSLGDKKFDRYLLPVFLALDLLAAFGWVALARLWQRRRDAATSAPRRRRCMVCSDRRAAGRAGLAGIRLRAILSDGLQSAGGRYAHGAPGDAGGLGRRAGGGRGVHQRAGGRSGNACFIVVWVQRPRAVPARRIGRYLLRDADARRPVS